jgi:glutamate racemase
MNRYYITKNKSEGYILSNDIRPIGVFDSGVGGLSVLREIRRELPGEDLLYVADSGYAPYGDMSEQLIEARSVALIEFLLNRQAKAIVVACNTVTGVAIRALRARFPVPIVGMEPAVKPAAATTKSGVVGVLATTRTLSSDNFIRLQERFGADVDIVVQACPGLADRVEAGDLTGDTTRALVERYVQPMLDQGADTIVLGCTHYPFLTALIQSITGPEVAIIDPAAAVARELRRRLEDLGLAGSGTNSGTERFWTSDSRAQAESIISRLWCEATEVLELPFD